ncbi:MFS transporter [Streptomyces sp. NPDC087440]|uniref:MFS transporter n=1 Tax=Streptomyces sp. NPDC087440 TaxID=3365790 RepID=UPI003811C5EB
MTTTTTALAPVPVRPSPASPSSAPSSLGPLALFTVLLGAALPLVDFFIVNVALPTIDRELAAGPAVLELVVAGYGVAYAVLLVLGGRLGDMFGRRRLFLWGMAAFGLTSLACGLAPDAGTLVAARVAQGAASALMLPQVLATIQASTAGERRAKAMGLYGATAGLAGVAGQILGGVLVAADLAGTGWRSIFLVNVPVVLLGLLLAARSVPESRSERPAPVDVPGTLLLALSLLTLLVPLTEGRAAGWPLWTWVSLGAFPFVALAFFLVERRADRAGRVPLVPPSMFAVASMRRGLPPIVPFSVNFGGYMFVLAVALQQGLGKGAVAAGMTLVPMALAYFGASLAGPKLIGRWGGRVAVAGSLIQATGFLVLVGVVWREWPELGFGALLPAMVLTGLGQGLQLPVLMRIVLSEVPAERAGVGSGVMVTAQQAALGLGVATLGTLFLGLAEGVGMRGALVWTVLVQVAVAGVTGLLSLRLPREVV